jgi:hypothetical protein
MDFEVKKSNHQANIVRLNEPRVHTNADTLELFDIGGYQVVTKKGNFKAGDLAVYIQPDNVVPQTQAFEFVWGGVTNELETVSERRRRITVRKFRKEWSEGLLMPLSDFPEFQQYCCQPFEGDDVSDCLGITHWEGEIELGNTSGETDSRPKRKYPKTLKGWFYFLLFKAGFKSARRQMNEELAFEVPKFDVESFKNFKNTILPGEQVIVTEKIHGSQGRFFFREGRTYAGSRNFWMTEGSTCIWNTVLKEQPWIETWCRANEGAVLYGEVVPTQKGYTYGCDSATKAKCFIFDIRSGVNGEYLPKQTTLYDGGLVHVPILYEGPWQANLLGLADGPTHVPHATGPREGCVVTVLDPTRWQRGLGRIQLKVVSNAFLEKDSR